MRADRGTNDSAQRIGSAALEFDKSKGLCKGTDPEIFHPDRGERAKEQQAVCEDCPIKTPCLEYAITNNIKFGIWGGESARQRKRTKNERT